MKLFHLSDLHIGKRVHEFSMIEDQKYMLTQILQAVMREKPDGVLISGDVYDRTIPTAEAVQVLDAFLTSLSEQEVPVFIISGNHDSAARLNCFRSILSRQNVYMIGTPPTTEEEYIEKVTLQDAYGDLHFYLLPFVKPSMVREIVGTREDGTQHSYDEALHLLIERENIDTKERNVLVSHQFYLPAGKEAEEVERMDSEIRTVGNIDEVSAEILQLFDYAALGHIHKPQAMGREMVRYAGSILKYSFSEIHHKKSVTIVEMKEKGNVEISTKELAPLRDWCEMKGTYMELTEKAYYENLDQDSYMHITLTDEEDIPEAVRKLQVIYPNLMKLDYDNQRTRGKAAFLEAAEAEEKTPFDIFEELYEKQNNQEMNEEQKKLIHDLIEKIWEGGH